MRTPWQVWFDSPDSLALRYRLAGELGLRGVGAWHLDCLDYRCAEPGCSEATAAMWAALAAFTGQDAAAAAAARGGGLALQQRPDRSTA